MSSHRVYKDLIEAVAILPHWSVYRIKTLFRTGMTLSKDI